MPSFRSDQWWLISILFSLARDVYDLSIALSEHNNSRNSNSKSDSSNGVASKPSGGGGWLDFAARNRALLLDTVTNCLDVWLPLAYLAYCDLPDWFVGGAGVISSITAAIPHVHPSFKMHPSN